jgi:hypothetical protein
MSLQYGSSGMKDIAALFIADITHNGVFPCSSTTVARWKTSQPAGCGHQLVAEDQA